MVKINNVQIVGMSRALDFRRSFNSQNKSDSDVSFKTETNYLGYTTIESVSMMPVDLKRLSTLVLSGDSHAKVNRFIIVYLDLTLPRRVWVDFDTYRIGRKEGLYPDEIEYFSDSTMHTLDSRLLTAEDFDEYTPEKEIVKINAYITCYQQSKSQQDFLTLKSVLGEGFLQTRTVMLNYQVLRHIYFDRRRHLQPEFIDFCKWIESLPLASHLITKEAKAS